MAAEELKKNGADLRDFLANKGVIPAASFPTPAEIAAHLTPGDAKALVQELIKQYAVKPDRLVVFKALAQHVQHAGRGSSQGVRKRQRRKSADRSTFRTPDIATCVGWLVSGVFVARSAHKVCEGNETPQFHFPER